MLLITQLADGSSSPSNIVFYLHLERARWQSLLTTTQMRFRSVTKTFWLIVYRLLRGTGIRLFFGPENCSQVVAMQKQWGKYDHKKSKVNLQVLMKDI